MDEIDEIVAGQSFKIRYLGKLDIEENNECKFHQTAKEMLAQYSPKSLEILPKFELVIDSTSLMITDRIGQEKPVELLTISLRDIRDVLYRKRDKHYGNVCIFVARDKPQSSSLKAHVLLCDNPVTTQKVFQTFCSAFDVINANDKQQRSSEELSHFESAKTPIKDLNSSINEFENNNSTIKFQEIDVDPKDKMAAEPNGVKDFDEFSCFVYSRTHTI